MSYTTSKQRKIGKAVLTTFVLFFLVIIAISVAGCSTPAAPAADPKASSAAAPVEEPTEEPAPEDDGIRAFGETVTWANNVSISVSEPADYTPTEMAAGVVEGQKTVVFELVLTNNSDEKYDPLVYNTAVSGGEAASGVFDTSEGVGFPPNTTLLPGKTIKWLEAYSVADAADIQLEVSAGFEYDSIIFTNNK